MEGKMEDRHAGKMKEENEDAGSYGHTALLTAVEVSTITALLMIKDALVVLHQVAQLLSQL